MAVAQVRPAEFDDWLSAVQASGPVMVLDVREAWEVATAQLPPQGFEVRHVPMGQVPQQCNAWSPNAPVACLCHHGARSQRVAEFLAAQGFTQVVNISGGIARWAQERDPSVPSY